MSWLQPVDIGKVVKRICRFVSALIKKNTAMAEDHSEFSSIDDLIAAVDCLGEEKVAQLKISQYN